MQITLHTRTFCKMIAMCLCAILILISRTECVAAPPISSPPKMAGLRQAAKLLFTENLGQVVEDKGQHRPDILFTAHSGATQLFLTATSINYQFTKITYPDGYDPMRRSNPMKLIELEKQIKKETYKFSVSLEGGNANPIIKKELKNNYTENFYTTGCLDGITNAGTYERIVYENVYPHIDWVLYSNGSGFKYDFLVHPGGNPKQIQLKIEDAGSTEITKEGELLIKTTLGEVTEKAPVSYAGSKQVKSTFKKNDNGTIGFDMEAYEGELRIDPSVVWATYYGGGGGSGITSNGDNLYDCVLDKSGHLYAAGTAESHVGIATAGAYQTTFGGFDLDAFLVKFDTSGNRIWATYYGGSGNDWGFACATDRSDNIYLSGELGSSGLATTGAYQTSIISPATSCFLAKFNSSGLRLWATYYGNTSYEGHCQTDKLNNVYLSGASNSTTGIASAGTYQTTFAGGSYDGFLAKFDSLGNRKWGTYYGGSGSDEIDDLAIDSSLNIYLAGTTNSVTNIASASAFQTTFNGGNWDAFIVKFDSSCTKQWATYYGGSGDDQFSSIAIDRQLNIYLAAQTTSLTGIASGNVPASFTVGTFDAFLAKFSSTGQRQWGTYIGGSGYNGCGHINADIPGAIYIVGNTGSPTGIATANAYQGILNGTWDAFLQIFDTAGVLQYGTYFGGNSIDGFSGLKVDQQQNVYCVGSTESTSGVATAGAFQPTFGMHSTNALIVKFGSPFSITTGSISSGNLCASSPISIPFTITGSYNSSNIFTAQLSNAAGSFAAPVTIGTLSGTTSGSIPCTIPANTPAGIGYRIRVISSSPAVIGSDNGTNLTIVPIVSSPYFVSGSSSSRCQGAGTVTYIAAATNNTGITYILDTATAHYAGNSIDANTGAVTYAAGWSGTTAITAIAGGCAGPVTALHTVTVYPLPAEPGAFVLSAHIVCQGQSTVTYAVPLDTTVTYAWTYSGVGATISSGGNSAEVSYSSNATPGVLQVIPTSNGCSGPSRTESITVNPSPPAAVAGNSPIFCPIDTVLITANAGAGLIYQWQLDSTNITGATGNTIFATAPGNYTVVETNSYNCSTVSNIVPVSHTPVIPRITALGNTGFCEGDSVTLQANTYPGLTYFWKLNGIYISAATHPVYTADVSASYTVYESDGTCDAISPPLHVLVNPLPPAIITTTGPAFFCIGGTITLHANAGNTSPYAYQYILNGVNIVTGTTQDYTTNFTGSYTVKVTTPEGCSSTSSYFPVSNYPQPLAMVTPQGPLAICSADSLLLTANAGTSLSYQWLQNNNPITGANTLTYIVHNAGNYAVKVIDFRGCSDTSNPAIVTITPGPSVVVSPVGSNTICAPGSVLLNAATGIGYTYQWMQNGTTIAGATASNYPASATGIYNVNISNGLCAVTSAPVSVIINPLPPDTLIVFAPGVICGSGTLLMRGPINSNYLYQWQLDGNNINGAASAYYSAPLAGSYAVRIATAAGCSVITRQVQVATAPLPTPTIFFQGNQLCVSGYNSYQWYYNNLPIAGAISSCIYPSLGGGYTVAVTDSAGCSAMSPVYSLSTGINNVVQADIKIYPNPATSMVYISAPAKVNTLIGSIDGRQLIYTEDAKAIDISALPNTVYILRVYDPGGTLVKVEKLVKTGL
ncbi:MAG: SBBP repeat-containing protein [Flavipsychrobacter sp.]|nr:SBBP repeat-containing protein [Flavipsychrobacter sp.]